MRRILGGLTAVVLVLAPVAASTQTTTPSYTAPPGGYAGPLYPTGEPVVAPGDVGKNQPIMTIPVRFSFTGTLQAPVSTITTVSKPKTLPAGQPMFAMLFGSRLDVSAKPKVIWCTPIRPDMAKPRWTTICLPEETGTTARWVDAYMLLPVIMQWSTSNPALAKPDIKSGPADFGVPIVLSYRLRQIDAKDMDIDIYLSIDGYADRIGQVHPRRLSDGSAILPILGGAIRLMPTDKKTVRAEVIKPLSAESPDLLL